MLVRAARRKLQRHERQSLQSSFAQLQLPWLCPALLSGNGARSYKSTTTAKRIQSAPVTFLRPDSTPLRLSHTHTRGLAYEAPFAHEPPPETYIPFENVPFANPNLSARPENTGFPWAQGAVGRNNLTGLGFDPTSPLIFNDTLATAPRRFRSTRDGKTFAGELSEIHDNFRACLQVNRLDMAEAALRRLNVIYKPDAPELAQLHNEYIEKTTTRLVTDRTPGLLRRIQKWFEVNMRGEHTLFNGKTIAYMIRASFQEPNQLKIGRTIRRYIGLADEAGIRDEAMAATLSLLSEQEMGQVTRLAPMTFPQAEEIMASNSQLDTTIGSIGVGVDTSIPEIMPTHQKGLGLAAVQKSVQLFYEESPHHVLDPQISSEEAAYATALERQIRLEEQTLDTAIDRWRVENENDIKRFGIQKASNTKYMGSLLWEWHQSLIPLLKEEVRKAEDEVQKLPEQVDSDVQFLCPFLQLVSPEKMSAIAILTTLNAMSIYGVDRGFKVSLLVKKIGAGVEDESNAQNLSDITIKNLRNMDSYRRSRFLSLLAKNRQGVASGQQRPDSGTPSGIDATWSTAVKARLGAVLLSHLLRSATMTVSREDPKTSHPVREVQPAFWNTREFSNGKRMGVVRMNAALVTKLSNEPVAFSLSKHLPMIVKPVPWTDFRKGGFTRQPVKVVRTGPHAQLKRYIQAASKNGDMRQIFAGLDILGKTPWKINRPVFNVMVEAWNEGDAIANIVPSNSEHEYPPEPEQSKDRDAHREWLYRVRKIDNQILSFHSQRCFQNFQMEVARAYLNETFYFPHSVDFRGRAYPVPPYLNHMGADNCRGLLMFGEGKELGNEGLVWLKVHLANVFGYDKASFRERRQFTEGHLSEIYNSASSPLKGNRWWLKAEDPWQCLAACIELKNALESSDPVKYVSHLPIHQDGTCNGLQHYAALGGDSIGAKQVNLEPGERPSDIYTAVADMVSSEVSKEAKEGNRTAQLLDGKVNRKVVKHTVMTNVYGVTFSGARMQVRRVLEDLIPDFPWTPDLNIHSASGYVARKIFKALSVMFNGAHHIQAWLGECASRICESLSPEQMQWIEDYRAGKPQTSQFSARATNDKNNTDEQMRFKQSVIWTTPLKMPVVQPYRTTKQRVIKTRLQHISIYEPAVADSVDKRKQLQGFPPNFIHSLDASHMMLSALKCDEVGLMFAAVHDSFWTHAADVDTMNRILRDAFIKMHSDNIIGRLAAEFEARYKGSMYLASVSAHSPLGKKIIDYRSKIRKEKPRSPSKQGKRAVKEVNEDKSTSKELPHMDELLEERRRLQLLSSTDPTSLAEADQILTPTRMLAEAQASSPSDLISLYENELLSTDIGEVSSARRSGTRDDIEDSEIIALADPDDEDTELLVQSLETDGSQQDLNEEEKSKAYKAKAASRTRKRYLRQQIKVWMPLTFPPVPEKGDFDVSRLRNSQYFFS